jgi:hypothetical protein
MMRRFDFSAKEKSFYEETRKPRASENNFLVFWFPYEFFWGVQAEILGSDVRREIILPTRKRGSACLARNLCRKRHSDGRQVSGLDLQRTRPERRPVAGFGRPLDDARWLFFFSDITGFCGLSRRHVGTPAVFRIDNSMQ